MPADDPAALGEGSPAAQRQGAQSQAERAMRLQPPCHVHPNHCFPHYDADLSKLGWVVIVAGSVVQTWLSCAGW